MFNRALPPAHDVDTPLADCFLLFALGAIPLFILEMVKVVIGLTTTRSVVQLYPGR